jgi:hypothetical protein
MTTRIEAKSSKTVLESRLTRMTQTKLWMVRKAKTKRADRLGARERFSDAGAREVSDECD